jgi:uncharacterized protein YjbJ (UPF0337 family)
MQKLHLQRSQMMKFARYRNRPKWGFVLVVVFFMCSPTWANSGQSYFSFEEGAMQDGFIHKVYNQDQFEGNWKQLKGAIKEKWGEFTNDDLMVIDGRADKFEGIAQERYGERKEEVKEWVEQWLEDHPYDPPTKRNP